MTFEIREARPADAEAIVALLGAHWKAEGWSRAKHAHYYRDYPEGEPLAVVATENDSVVAHTGLLPIQISGMRAHLVLQVLVSPLHRRGGTLVELMRFAEAACRKRGSKFVCGFGNRRFTKVAHRFLGWRVPGYLRFADVESIDVSAYRSRFRFEYTDAWYRWKLGVDDVMPAYVKAYQKDDTTLHQLLKTRGAPRVVAHDLSVPSVNLWHPDRTQIVETDDWIQPFLLAPLTDDLPAELLDLRNWYVEMGDSDTFEPWRPWLQGNKPSYARTI